VQHEVIAVATEGHRDHERLAVDADADVRDERFVENRVRGVARVVGTFRSTNSGLRRSEFVRGHGVILVAPVCAGQRISGVRTGIGAGTDRR
jgi:hypothetical protein